MLMVKIGNFEIEYDRKAPERVAVKIETDKNGEVWLSKCGHTMCSYSQ